MPRKPKTDQPAAENDPMNVFVQAAREFKKEPSVWAENGLYESLTPLIAEGTQEFDSAKVFDSAFRLFKSHRSQATAQLLMEAAALYKSNYVAKIGAKFGVFVASTIEQLELPGDGHDQDDQ